MRVFSVPGRYASVLEGAVSRAVDQIRNDIYRRQNGEQPVIEDFMIDAQRDLNAFVIVGEARDALVDAIGRVAALPREPKRKRRA